MGSQKPEAGRDPTRLSFPDGYEIDAAIPVSGLQREQNSRYASYNGPNLKTTTYTKRLSSYRVCRSAWQNSVAFSASFWGTPTDPKPGVMGKLFFY
jgi:hypothetical protein